jgi:hypothetical protein
MTCPALKRKFLLNPIRNKPSESSSEKEIGTEITGL